MLPQSLTVDSITHQDYPDSFGFIILIFGSIYMSFDLNSLELFVRVATVGAIGKAGQDIGFSATNASARIKTLEQDLQTNLFHRTTRTISLTADGEVFLEHAKRILDAVDAAHSSLTTNNGAVRGTLKVTAPVIFAKTHITPFLPEFMAKHTGLDLDLHLTDSIVDMVGQGYDLAFRIGELAPSSLLARKIDDNPIRLVAAPSYLDRMGIPNSVKDLEQHICLPLGSDRKWRLRGQSSEVSVVKAHSPVRVNLGDAVSDLVLAGVGIGQASLWHAGPDLRAGRLKPVLPDYLVVPERKIWAVRPPGPYLPQRLQVFLSFIQGRIRKSNQEIYGDLMPELFPGMLKDSS